MTKRFCPKCEKESVGPVKYCPDDGYQLLTKDDDPMIQKTILKEYEILMKLGGGGMGTVYTAKQLSTSKIVAIKMLHARGRTDEDLVIRFKREALLASKLNNIHCINVFDFGKTEDGTLFIVMEYLKGKELSQLVREKGRFSIAETIDIGKQICEALTEAHNLGIIHRDLKLENIMLLEHTGKFDFVKILDFGIAKDITIDGDRDGVSIYGAIFGTPEYFSPELSRGLSIDTRADIYAVGVILYKMASGKFPFKDDNIIKMIQKHAYDPPPLISAISPDLQIPGKFEALIMKALEKDPNKRFQTATEMYEALESISMKLLHSTPSEITESRKKIDVKVLEGYKLKLAIVSLILCLLFALIAFFFNRG